MPRYESNGWQRLVSTQNILVRLTIRMEKNFKSDDWPKKTRGEEAFLFSAASVGTHHLEPLALAVYCSISDTITAMLAVLQGDSLTPRFSEWVDESLDRPHRIGQLHTT